MMWPASPTGAWGGMDGGKLERAAFRVDREELHDGVPDLAEERFVEDGDALALLVGTADVVEKALARDEANRLPLGEDPQDLFGEGKDVGRFIHGTGSVQG